MAVVNVAQSFNMLSAQDWTWEVTAAGPTSITISDGVHTQTFSGSFAYDAQDNVSGSVTATSYYVNGALVFSASGLNLSAATMQTFAETFGDTQATYAYVLAGADTINGSSGADVLLGYNGNDLIKGGSGNDKLIGGAGNDSLVGGLGGDTLAGGVGNDVCYVDSSLDVVSEASGAGTDSVLASVSFTLAANVERLTLTGTNAINGSGNALANVLNGNAEANVLSGKDGDDTLAGGGGNDLLAGGLGKDQLTGGAGLDEFRFNTVPNSTSNTDRITDFSHADDHIGLYSGAFGGIGAVGTLAVGAFRAGTAAGDAGDRIIYDAATGHLFFDADGSGAAAQVLFATVTANTAMAANDFVIY